MLKELKRNDQSITMFNAGSGIWYIDLWAVFDDDEDWEEAFAYCNNEKLTDITSLSALIPRTSFFDKETNRLYFCTPSYDAAQLFDWIFEVN